MPARAISPDQPVTAAPPRRARPLWRQPRDLTPAEVREHALGGTLPPPVATPGSTRLPGVEVWSWFHASKAAEQMGQPRPALDRRPPLSLQVHTVVGHRDGGRCLFPGCTASMFSSYLVAGHRSGLSTEATADPVEGLRFHGQVAHIHSWTPRGPRYRRDLSTEQVSSDWNLLTLCPVHHRQVDLDEAAYPAHRLHAWRQTSQDQALNLPLLADLAARLGIAA